MMKKTIRRLLCVLFAVCAISGVSASASSATHTVVAGDTMWRIAVRYQVGTSEIIAANPQVKNPNLIYPGEVLTVPLTDEGVRAFEQEVIRLTNEYRAQYGLPALRENWELSRVARYKAQDMSENRYFSHTSPTYGSPFQMIRAFGLSYRAAGENIAYGYSSPQAVVNGWIHSEGHRANILNRSYTQIGVGYFARGNYWSQMFLG